MTYLGRVVAVALGHVALAEVVAEHLLPGLGVVVRVRPHQPRRACALILFYINTSSISVDYWFNLYSKTQIISLSRENIKNLFLHSKLDILGLVFQISCPWYVVFVYCIYIYICISRIINED